MNFQHGGASPALPSPVEARPVRDLRRAGVDEWSRADQRKGKQKCGKQCACLSSHVEPPFEVVEWGPAHRPLPQGYRDSCRSFVIVGFWEKSDPDGAPPWRRPASGLRHLRCRLAPLQRGVRRHQRRAPRVPHLRQPAAYRLPPLRHALSHRHRDLHELRPPPESVRTPSSPRDPT